MDSPSMNLYATEAIDEGIRIYRSDDALFETRLLDRTETRLYTDGEAWYAKARFPETAVEDAYNRLMEAAEDINDAYGTALDMSPPEFLEQADMDGEVHLSEGRTALHYMEDTNLAALIDDLFDAPARSSILKGVLTSSAAEIGGGTAVGAGIGAAIGAFAGPPGILAGAAAGAALGGAGMGALAGAEGCVAIFALAEPGSMDLDQDMPMVQATRYFEEKRKEEYTAIDAVEDHLATVNQLHSMEEELEAIREMDLERHEELEELRDSNVQEVHDVLMDVHFRRFEENEGATVVHEADTYAEARDFLTTVTGERVGPHERPSFYTAPGAFTTIFDRCTYTERGREKYLDDATVLVRNVYDCGDVPEEITSWLERRHRTLVQDIGRKRSWREGGSDGDSGL